MAISRHSEQRLRASAESLSPATDLDGEGRPRSVFSARVTEERVQERPEDWDGVAVESDGEGEEEEKRTSPI